MNLTDTIIQQLKARDPLPPLFPTKVWDADLSDQIQQMTQLDAAVRAGLLLWNDDLEASHTLSQSIDDATGSFWHAIMHRREGDASNAEYWCRRIGAHPALRAIHQAALAAVEGDNAADVVVNRLRLVATWLPESFVYDCQTYNRGLDTGLWILKVQVAEIETLLNWCLAQ